MMEYEIGKQIPLKEGEVPSGRRLALRDGKWVMEQYEIEYDPDWEDPEIFDTEEYSQEDKDEWYDYVIRCNKCRTEFMAYNVDGEKTMNYCPECGAKLK